MARKRVSDFTPFSERLTPAEVADYWFRRDRRFGASIHNEHPDFPRPGPDGLFLRCQVLAWFELFHGLRRRSGERIPDAEAEALAIARFGRQGNKQLTSAGKHKD